MQVNPLSNPKNLTLNFCKDNVLNDETVTSSCKKANLFSGSVHNSAAKIAIKRGPFIPNNPDNPNNLGISPNPNTLPNSSSIQLPRINSFPITQPVNQSKQFGTNFPNTIFTAQNRYTKGMNWLSDIFKNLGSPEDKNRRSLKDELEKLLRINIALLDSKRESRTAISGVGRSEGAINDSVKDTEIDQQLADIETEIVKAEHSLLRLRPRGVGSLKRLYEKNLDELHTSIKSKEAQAQVFDASLQRLQKEMRKYLLKEDSKGLTETIAQIADHTKYVTNIRSSLNSEKEAVEVLEHRLSGIGDSESRKSNTQTRLVKILDKIPGGSGGAELLKNRNYAGRNEWLADIEQEGNALCDLIENINNAWDTLSHTEQKILKIACSAEIKHRVDAANEEINNLAKEHNFLGVTDEEATERLIKTINASIPLKTYIDAFDAGATTLHNLDVINFNYRRKVEPMPVETQRKLITARENLMKKIESQKELWLAIGPEYIIWNTRYWEYKELKFNVEKLMFFQKNLSNNARKFLDDMSSQKRAEFSDIEKGYKKFKTMYPPEAIPQVYLRKLLEIETNNLSIN
jgi:hypothetical protein